MDIVTLGALLVDFFPAEVGVELSEVSAFRPVPGGAPANVAVAAARLGRKSAFIGKVGADDFGRWLADTLDDEKVDVRGMRFDPDHRTTLAFLARPDVHSYTCLFYRNPGADTCLAPEELDRDLLAGAKAFHCDSLALTDEPSCSAALAGMRLARGAGALVSFDANYRAGLWPSPEAAVEQIRAVLPLVDLLKVNEGELRLLTGSEAPESARALLALGPRLVVVTLGERGSYYQTATGCGLAPAFPVRTVDATGCGDAFVAGLLCQLIDGAWLDKLATARLDRLDRLAWRAALEDPARLAQALRYANAVGALTATAHGVIPALPFKPQVDALIAES